MIFLPIKYWSSFKDCVRPLEIYPVAEVRKDRKKGDHLEVLRLRVVVKHERIEVVRDVADTDIHVMGHFSCLEREAVAQIEAEDRRHVVVVDLAAVVIARHNLVHQMGKVIDLTRTVLPVTATACYSSAEATPLRHCVQHVPAVEAGIELPAIADVWKTKSVRLGNGVG